MPSENIVLKLPNLVDSHLTSIRVFLRFRSEDDAASVHTAPVRGHVKFDNDVYVQYMERLRSRDPEEEVVHLQVEKSTDSELLFGELSADELQQRLSRFYGKPCKTWILSTFLLPVQLLSPLGVIQPFLGLATSAANITLAFTGATMSIQDDYLNELSWKRKDEMVEVTIDAFTALEIDDDFLLTSERMLRDAISRLVLSEGANDD